MSLRLLLTVTFAMLLAHFAWRTWCDPPSGEYRIGGEVQAMVSPHANQRHAYFRHTFHTPIRPEFGWLQILGRSRITLYVNGTEVVDRELDGLEVAVLVDITPYLKRGRNVIAIRTQHAPFVQSAMTFPDSAQALVAVDGQYDAGKGVGVINHTCSWRCSGTPQLGKQWWFEPEYDDQLWSHPDIVQQSIRAVVEIPPASIRQSARGAWIGPPSDVEGRCVLYRKFRIPKGIESAGLKLCSSADYRLAINGIVCDVQEHALGTDRLHNMKHRIYDLTSHLHTGENVIAVAITGESIRPRLLASLGLQSRDSTDVQCVTDTTWQSIQGVSPGWPAVRGDSSPVIQDAGHPYGPPWTLETETQPITMPTNWLVRDGAYALGLFLLIALVVEAACRFMQNVLRLLSIDASRRLPPTEIAIVLPAFGLFLLFLASFDPRVDAFELYRARTLGLAIGGVIGQWLILCVLATSPRLAVPSESQCNGMPRPIPRFSALAIIFLFGCLVRYAQIDAKPLQHDEASALRSTQGFFDRGFPSRQIHPDVPTKYVETSELVYFLTVASSLVFDEDRQVVRFPAFCFGAATILLMYLVGSRMFGPPAGLIASATYALSPICIQMSCFGRYFTQLQFFCLLTVFLFWLTIRGSGRVQRNYLVGTAASFLAMYFTWQGSALIAVGMIVALCWERRKSMHSVLRDSKVWLAVAVVGCIVILHINFRSLHLVQFLTYGSGISNLSFRSMWKLSNFDITYCIWESAWNRDALFPLLGVIGGCLLATCHPLRGRVRFILLALLTTAFLQALLLPVYTWRYSFHLMPFGILLFSASLFALCRSLIRSLKPPLVHRREHPYPRFVAVCTGTALVLSASGMTLQLTELPSVHIHGYSLPDLRFSDLSGAAAYLQEHLQGDDTVLASNPHVVDHFLGEGATDYWPQSVFYTQAVLDDWRQVPLHRIAGTTMLSSLREWEELFASRGRIWYVLVPSRHAKQNNSEVSAYLRQHMQIAYEGDRVMVLVRDNENRTARQRLRNDRTLLQANADFLAE